MYYHIVPYCRAEITKQWRVLFQVLSSWRTSCSPKQAKINSPNSLQVFDSYRSLIKNQYNYSLGNIKLLVVSPPNSYITHSRTLPLPFSPFSFLFLLHLSSSASRFGIATIERFPLWNWENPLFWMVLARVLLHCVPIRCKSLRYRICFFRSLRVNSFDWYMTKSTKRQIWWIVLWYRYRCIGVESMKTESIELTHSFSSSPPSLSFIYLWIDLCHETIHEKQTSLRFTMVSYGPQLVLVFWITCNVNWISTGQSLFYPSLFVLWSTDFDIVFDTIYIYLSSFRSIGNSQSRTKVRNRSSPMRSSF